MSDHYEILQRASDLAEGSCEHGNESLGYIKGGEFLHRLNDFLHLKKESVPFEFVTSFKQRSAFRQLNNHD
jgi:hypothetical protein